jgi:hypothetical protein
MKANSNGIVIHTNVLNKQLGIDQNASSLLKESKPNWRILIELQWSLVNASPSG